MTETDYKALATKKFEEWNKLLGEDGRMQEDADFFNMVRATKKLLDADDQEIPNSVHVLLNDIATFTWEVETELNSAIEQVQVVSESKRFDTSYVEGFIEAAFRDADKFLSNQGMFPFTPFIDQQTFRRGRVAAKCFFRFEKGKFITEITPWDTKYVVPEYDDGLSYIASKFYRSENKVLSAYPEAEGKTSQNTELFYILAKDTTQMWLGDSLLKALPNTLGYVPAVYHMVPMGSMLWDIDTIEYQGESGIFLVRILFTELERIASIIQSLNLKVVDQALQIQKPVSSSAGTATQGKTVDQLNAPGAVNETPENTRYELMPLGQLQAAFDRLYQMIQERMQRGTSRKYQNVLQPKTATEIMMEAQQQGNIVLPRLGTRGLLKQDLSYMFIKQTIDACSKTKVQTVKLDGTEWEVSKLKGDYSIEFKYHFADPRMDAARQSLATSQRGLIPDKDIRINTLQREDPEADERQLRWEEDERLSPIVKLDRNIRALLEDAKRGEPGAGRQAKMLIIQMIPALRQAMEGLMTPNMPEELESPEPMMPLLPTGTTQPGGEQ